MKDKKLLNLESLEQRTLFAGPGDDLNLISTDLISGLGSIFGSDFAENQEVAEDAEINEELNEEMHAQEEPTKEKHSRKRSSRFDTSDFDWYSNRKRVERPTISFKLEDYGTSSSSDQSFSEAFQEFAQDTGEALAVGLKFFANHFIGIGPAKERFSLIPFISKTLGFGEVETQPIQLSKALGLGTLDSETASEPEEKEAPKKSGIKSFSGRTSEARDLDWLGFL